jgi:release factor glutamine methyltransferase
VIEGAARRRIKEALREAERELEAAGVEECLLDARLLLAHAMAASPTWVFAHEDEAVPGAAFETFRALLARRRSHEPLQHLVGTQEFWSLPIGVSRDVLIPRPETELLVEAVLEAVRDVPAPRIADVGTGSGCIAIALAAELPRGVLVGTDVSAAALRQAWANARELGFESRIDMREGHLVEPLRDLAPFDAVAANLPYVSHAEWQSLQPEVRDHDPALALRGGERGTELIVELVAAAPAVLVPGGTLALEVGMGQAGTVADALNEHGYCDVRTLEDFAGIDRVVVARRD